MPVRNAICIAVDGLRASSLGAYGNTWHATPALDALASQSLVVDWMWSDFPTLEGFYSSVWNAGERVLAKALTAAGVVAALTTDDRWTAERAEAAGFSEVRCLETGTQQSAAAVDETEFAQLFAIAIDHLQTWSAGEKKSAKSSPPRLLWLHARGFHGAWEAPLELRQSLLEEDDPPAPTFVIPPANVVAEDHDAVLLYRAAYAAQTIVLDECLGALVAALDEFGLGRDTLLILVGCRGYPLGEHGAVGGDVRNLYSELLHVPCLVRTPGTACPPPRRSQLVLPMDLGATLVDWFSAAAGLPPRAVSLLAPEASLRVPGSRQYIVARGEHNERAIRTPAWMLRATPLAANDMVDRPPARVELYAKPDDRWEANEVADRLPEIAARLLAVLDSATAGGDLPADSRSLDDDLLTPNR